MVGFHLMASKLLTTPELALDTDQAIFEGNTESRYLATHIKAVADHYVNVKIDPKWTAWINLGMCLGAVYGTRVEAIRMRWRYEAQMRQDRRGPQGVRQNVSTQGPDGAVNGVPVEPPSTPREMRTGTIPGVGEVEFEPGHPLAGGKRH